MESRKFARDEQSSTTYHTFLNSLKGKMVTIYRGGPESKTGKLLDVSEDYVTLQVTNENDNNDGEETNKENHTNNNNENNKEQTVIYYQAHHLKSVSEDSKKNSMQLLEEENGEDVEYIQAENFFELIDRLKGEKIQINQGGPEVKNGDLLGSAQDFLVLNTEDDGVVYYHVYHVKSISKYKDNQNNEQQTTTYPTYVEANTFHDVFKQLTHKWVSINRGGPEATEGVLVGNEEGHYTLVNNEEVLRIHPFHIKNISTGAKGYFKKMNNNEEKDIEANQETTEDNGNDSKGNWDEAYSHDFRSDRESRHSRSSRNRRSDRDKEHRRSRYDDRRSYRRESIRENVLETIDYVWKDEKK